MRNMYVDGGEITVSLCIYYRDDTIQCSSHSRQKWADSRHTYNAHRLALVVTSLIRSTTFLAAYLRASDEIALTT